MESAEKAALSFDTCVSIDSTEYVMFPLSYQKTVQESYGSSGSGRSETYWNIVFYNIVTKKYHLLDANHKMLIYNYEGQQLTGNESLKNELNRLMYYQIVTDDYNHDGKLDDNDPKYLFVSDKAGNNFKQISPKGFNVNNYEILSKQNKIIIKTNSDSNHDNVFNDDDQSVPFVYDLKTGAPAEQVFNKEFNAGIRALFNKRWPLKKEN